MIRKFWIDHIRVHAMLRKIIEQDNNIRSLNWLYNVSKTEGVPSFIDRFEQ